jgi:hypothetical protein
LKWTLISFCIFPTHGPKYLEGFFAALKNDPSHHKLWAEGQVYFRFICPHVGITKYTWGPAAAAAEWVSLL